MAVLLLLIIVGWLIPHLHWRFSSGWHALAGYNASVNSKGQSQAQLGRHHRVNPGSNWIGTQCEWKSD